MKTPIRILLAENRGLIRLGLRALLEKAPDIRVVAEAENTQDMLAQAGHVKPDVIVMATTLQNGDGMYATGRLHQQQKPRIPVLLVSTGPDGHEAKRAFASSASGFVLSNVRPRELCSAIRQIVQGKTYLDRTLTRKRSPDFPGKCTGRAFPDTVLTPRQGETLGWLAVGKNTKEIASLLHISPKTVDFHRMQLMKRLKTYTISGLVHAALRLGLVNVEPISRT